MIVLASEGFERHGIERKNQQRIAAERTAQAQRDASYANAQSTGTPVNTTRVDKQPMFQDKAPRIGNGSGGGGGGGGAFGLETIVLLVLAGAGLLARGRRK